MELLRELLDLQKVYANFTKELEQLEAELKKTTNEEDREELKREINEIRNFSIRRKLQLGQAVQR